MNSTKKISALLLSLLLSGVLLAGCGGGTGNSSGALPIQSRVKISSLERGRAAEPLIRFRAMTAGMRSASESARR